jgi:signal transduction histidine kinase
MNDVIPQMTMPRQDVTLGRGIAKADQIAGVAPAGLDDLVHDLRQPLSAIESLAYFLEITAADEKVRVHLQRIQAMVCRAHGILDRSLDSRRIAPTLS